MKKILGLIFIILSLVSYNAFAGELKADAGITVAVGPLHDVTDAITPETGVSTVAMDEAEWLGPAGAATVSITGWYWNAITGADGMYHMFIPASAVTTEGIYTLLLQDDDVFLPVFMDFTVKKENAYDADYTAGVTRLVEVTDFQQTAADQIDGIKADVESGVSTQVDTATIILTIESGVSTVHETVLAAESGVSTVFDKLLVIESGVSTVYDLVLVVESGVSTVHATTLIIETGVSDIESGLSEVELSTSGITEIFEHQITGNTTEGSAGKEIADGGAAGDPWGTAVPGAYTAGEAGYIIGNAVPQINSGITTIEAKLPTNYIMGSSAQGDLDDNILAAESGVSTNYVKIITIESGVSTSYTNQYAKLLTIESGVSTVFTKLLVIESGVSTNHTLSLAIQSGVSTLYVYVASGVTVSKQESGVTAAILSMIDSGVTIAYVMSGATTAIYQGLNSGVTTLYETSGVTGAIRDILEDLNLDHLLKVDTTVGADADLEDYVVGGTVMAHVLAISADATDFKASTDSLQAIRDSQTASDPLAHSATTSTEVTGTLDGGTYASTATNDGVAYYQVGPASAVSGFGLNANLTFVIGTGRVPASLIVDGKFSAAAARTVQVWAYNYFNSTYIQLSNAITDFNNAVNDSQKTYAMTTEMVQVSDGEITIRFTSTSETGTDVWNCDYMQINSVAQEAAGLSADAIQQAVWARADSGHDEETLGYNLAKVHLESGQIVSATDATQFVIDFDIPTNDIYNGAVITLEDKTDDHYEIRRVVDTIAASDEIIVDRAFGFTPVAGDDYYLMNAAYTDVTVAAGVTVIKEASGVTQAILDMLNSGVTTIYVSSGVTGAILDTLNASGVTVSVMGADVITAAAIATDAIASDELGTSAVTEILNHQLPGFTTEGSVGKEIADGGAAGDPWSTALPGAYGAGEAGYIVGSTIPIIEAGVSDIESGLSEVELSESGITEIFEHQLPGHATEDSAGKEIADGGAAGDPWGTAIPGAYGAGEAGHILGNQLPSVRSAVTEIATGVTAIQATTLATESGVSTNYTKIITTESGVSTVHTTTLATESGVSTLYTVVITVESGVSTVHATVLNIETGVTRIISGVTAIEKEVSLIVSGVTVLESGVTEIQKKVRRLQP